MKKTKKEQTQAIKEKTEIHKYIQKAIKKKERTKDINNK